MNDLFAPRDEHIERLKAECKRLREQLAKEKAENERLKQELGWISEYRAGRAMEERADG